MEPSGAAGIAAVLTRQFAELAAKHSLTTVAVVISGGNTDLHATHLEAALRDKVESL